MGQAPSENSEELLLLMFLRDLKDGPVESLYIFPRLIPGSLLKILDLFLFPDGIVDGLALEPFKLSDPPAGIDPLLKGIKDQAVRFIYLFSQIFK